LLRCERSAGCQRDVQIVRRPRARRKSASKLTRQSRGGSGRNGHGGTASRHARARRTGDAEAAGDLLGGASPASCLRSASVRRYCVKAVGRPNRTPALLARSRLSPVRATIRHRSNSPGRGGSSASAGRRASWCRPNGPGGCGSRRREVRLAQLPNSAPESASSSIVAGQEPDDRKAHLRAVPPTGGRN
jgi:hypothetical protein